MVVEFVISIVIGFVIVVVGSYIGAKLALNTFFGKDFDVSESRRFSERGSEPNPGSDSGER